MSSDEMSTSLFSEKAAFPVSHLTASLKHEFTKSTQELKIPTNTKSGLESSKDSESTSLSKSQLMSPVLDSSSVQLPKPSSGPMEVELPPSSDDGLSTAKCSRCGQSRRLAWHNYGVRVTFPPGPRGMGWSCLECISAACAEGHCNHDEHKKVTKKVRFKQEEKMSEVDKVKIREELRLEMEELHRQMETLSAQ